MKTEDLIVSLAAENRAVTPLPAWPHRLARWLMIALPASAILALAFGIRHDLGNAIDASGFVGSGFIGLSVMVAASVAALAQSVPGQSKPIVIAAPFGLLFGWLAVLVLSAFSAGATFAGIVHEPWHWACVSRVALLSLIPSLSLTFIVGRGFVMNRSRSAFLCFAAGGALAAGALQFVCPIDRAPHVLISHLVPVLLLAAAAALGQLVISSRK